MSNAVEYIYSSVLLSLLGSALYPRADGAAALLHLFRSAHACGVGSTPPFRRQQRLSAPCLRHRAGRETFNHAPSQPVLPRNPHHLS